MSARFRPPLSTSILPVPLLRTATRPSISKVPSPRNSAVCPVDWRTFLRSASLRSPTCNGCATDRVAAAIFAGTTSRVGASSGAFSDAAGTSLSLVSSASPFNILSFFRELGSSAGSGGTVVARCPISVTTLRPRTFCQWKRLTRASLSLTVQAFVSTLASTVWPTEGVYTNEVFLPSACSPCSFCLQSSARLFVSDGLPPISTSFFGRTRGINIERLR